MKRFAAILLISLLFLPVCTFADVIWYPDDYVAAHSNTCYRFPTTHCEYIALCDCYAYASPDDPTPISAFAKGSKLHIEYYCCDTHAHIWGLIYQERPGSVNPTAGWIPMDAVMPAYRPDDFFYDHFDECTPYAGEMDHLLPSQELVDACNQYRAENNGGYGGGGTPPYWAAFGLPGYTAWAYPNSPTRYPDVYSVDITPLFTYVDEDNLIWVYALEPWANETGNTDNPFWICVSDPEAEPDPRAKAITKPLEEAPHALPVPGQLAMEKVGPIHHLKPVYPVVLAVLGVVLLSAVLIVLFMRKKEA